MEPTFPSPTTPQDSRTDVLLGYLDYFRAVVVDKLTGLTEPQLRESVLPSGWSPLELLQHLTYVELRWLVWGFEGRPVAEPWGDADGDGVWRLAATTALDELLTAFHAQAEVSRAVVRAHGLTEVGQPGPRWDGQPPATLERVLLHLVQEYARHAGHLDVVRELLDGRVGE